MADEFEEKKRQLIEELANAKRDILNEVRLSKAQIEEAVFDILPREHEKDHDNFKRFLEHAPDPKVHGDHHDFTENVKANIQHMIVAVFKALGGVILLALFIGLYSWVRHQAG